MLIAVNIDLVTILPSGDVSVPKLIQENGSLFPALECIVFKSYINDSIAWSVNFLVFSIALLYAILNILLSSSDSLQYLSNILGSKSIVFIFSISLSIPFTAMNLSKSVNSKKSKINCFNCFLNVLRTPCAM